MKKYEIYQSPYEAIKIIEVNKTLNFVTVMDLRDKTKYDIDCKIFLEKVKSKFLIKTRCGYRSR